MAVAEFCRGRIVAIEGTNFEFRRKIKNHIWQLERCDTGQIIEQTHNELLALYEQGRLRIVLSSGNENGLPRSATALDLLPDETQAKTRRRYAYVAEVIRQGVLFLTEEHLSPVIDKVWESLGKQGKKPHWNTVYRWVRKVEDGGDDIRALRDKDSQKGNRKRRYDDRTYEVCEEMIDKYYLSMQRHTIEYVLHKTKEEIERQNTFLPHELHIQTPTRSLITQLIRRIPSFDVTMARFGREYAIRKFRSVKGSDFAEYPLQRVQIDHTKADLLLIDDETGLPLGRPTFTICVDVATRCVLGFYIGFEPPSFTAVAECLKHAILPKTYMKEKYPDVINDWEPYGVMEIIIVDNGMEFHSYNHENACYSLGITIEYKARKKSWEKGIVERLIGTFNRSVSHRIPGTTFSSFLDLKDYDPVKTAVATLSEFKGYAHKFFNDVYHVSIHRTLKCAPIELWRLGVEQQAPRLPISKDELEVQVGALVERSLSHKGIQLHNLQYNSPELNEIRKKYGDTLTVKVRYNPADISKIYVIDPETDQPIPAEVINGHWTYRMSEWQLSVCTRYARINYGSVDVVSLQKARDEISALVTQALGDKKIATRTRAARFAMGGAFNRKAQEVAEPTEQPVLPDEAKSNTESQVSYSVPQRAIPESFHSKLETEVVFPNTNEEFESDE